MPSAAPDAPVMEMVAGTVALGGHTVLSDIDFRIDPGEFVVLLGGNGSGKTTLVRALLGAVPLTAGQVALFGSSLRDFDNREWIGYVPQRITATSGVPTSVMEVVLSGRTARLGLLQRVRTADREAARRALEAVDLLTLAQRPVALLSGGQQQRVLIARALATEPKILVLDEPVASVDLAHQESFAHILEDLRNQGTTILLVAHALGAMERLVDRAVVLELGRIVHDGPPEGHPFFDQHRHHHHHPESQPEEHRL